MIELLSAPISAFGLAPGMADAGMIGASATVHAANPINKSRFMGYGPWIESRHRGD
jgi:hypothetical protein